MIELVIVGLIGLLIGVAIGYTIKWIETRKEIKNLQDDLMAEAPEHERESHMARFGRR